MQLFIYDTIHLTTSVVNAFVNRVTRFHSVDGKFMAYKMFDLRERKLSIVPSIKCQFGESI